MVLQVEKIILGESRANASFLFLLDLVEPNIIKITIASHLKGKIGKHSINVNFSNEMECNWNQVQKKRNKMKIYDVKKKKSKVIHGPPSN
jgi:hypothetical protein